MKRVLLTGVLLLLLSSCSKPNEKEAIEETSSTGETSTSVSSQASSTEVAQTSSSALESSEAPVEVAITAESLMADYPQWTLESGQTPVEYNEVRMNEANQRLRDNNLPEDDDYINRNPVILTREDEKAIRKNVGHMDYTPMEANVVMNGVTLIE